MAGAPPGNSGLPFAEAGGGGGRWTRQLCQRGEKLSARSTYRAKYKPVYNTGTPGAAGGAAARTLQPHPGRMLAAGRYPGPGALPTRPAAERRAACECPPAAAGTRPVPSRPGSRHGERRRRCPDRTSGGAGGAGGAGCSGEGWSFGEGYKRSGGAGSSLALCSCLSSAGSAAGEG